VEEVEMSSEIVALIFLAGWVVATVVLTLVILVAVDPPASDARAERDEGR
jgi:hypothetical protein